MNFSQMLANVGKYNVLCSKIEPWNTLLWTSNVYANILCPSKAWRGLTLWRWHHYLPRGGKDLCLSLVGRWPTWYEECRTPFGLEVVARQERGTAWKVCRGDFKIKWLQIRTAKTRIIFVIYYYGKQCLYVAWSVIAWQQVEGHCKRGLWKETLLYQIYFLSHCQRYLQLFSDNYWTIHCLFW